MIPPLPPASSFDRDGGTASLRPRYEDIAQAMDCPVGTVRSRIFRAREAIDKRLSEVFEGGLGRAEELG